MSFRAAWLVLGHPRVHNETLSSYPGGVIYIEEEEKQSHPQEHRRVHLVRGTDKAKRAGEESIMPSTAD